MVLKPQDLPFSEKKSSPFVWSVLASCLALGMCESYKSLYKSVYNCEPGFNM